jgi:hypothetical protein
VTDIRGVNGSKVFMRHFYYLLFFITIQLISGCNDSSSKTKKELTADVPKSPTPDSTMTLPPPVSGLKVAAYLIYKDGSTSSFDVLNDKSKALWNVIIGGADAEKP